MTKTELVNEILEYMPEHITKRDVVEFLESLTACCEGVIGNADAVTLPGIGRVACRVRSARNARNPQTGETIRVPAKVAVKITPVKSLKEAVPSVQKAKRIQGK